MGPCYRCGGADAPLRKGIRVGSKDGPDIHLCGDCLAAVVDEAAPPDRAQPSAPCVDCGAPDTPVREAAIQDGLTARVRRCEACTARVEQWRADLVRGRAARSRELRAVADRPAATDESRTALLVALDACGT